ncbi:MAG: RnfABCDGE type electron transport complex subunit G [Bacteroidales bacterium]|nr:RnfABCDGE type electron transport complex subunit G [Bacteroidales bacterium]
MAVQSNLKNMVLCLTGVCLVCAAILAGVYAITKAPIDETNAKLLKESIGAVLPEGGELSEANAIEVGGQPSEYYTLSADGETIAYAVKSTTVGFGGPLTLMVGITADGVIYNTSVLAHTETPGLGAKCTSDEHFMAQWKGFNPSEKILKVKSQQGDVDAITASTITSKAYTLAVENALNAVKSLMEEER